MAISPCGPSEGPFVHINDRYIIILETNLMVMRHIDRACRCNLDYILANDTLTMILTQFNINFNTIIHILALDIIIIK